MMSFEDVQVYRFTCMITFYFRFTGKKLTPLFHDDPYDGIVRGSNLYAWSIES
jgi:hypothetical protein